MKKLTYNNKQSASCVKKFEIPDYLALIAGALSGTAGGALLGSPFGFLGGLFGSLIGSFVTGYSTYKDLKKEAFK